MKTDVSLEERAAELPTRSGVYLFKDARGKVLYVGKAKNLRARVRQYITGQDSRYKVRYLVAQGADVMLVSRRGQTTVDMANGPVQRIQPFPATIALLESYGAINNHNCVSCE